MQFDKLFRKSFFGGFNKKDVEAYVKSLEDELEKVREEHVSAAEEGVDKSLIAESINEIKKLKMEREDMKNQITHLRTQLKNQTAGKEIAAAGSDADAYLNLVQENATLKTVSIDSRAVSSSMKTIKN